MKTERFDYRLPLERIAQEPLPERDASRLLVLDRSSRAWSDQLFRELPALLRPGDLLALNDTRVIPARLRATRDQTGGHVEVFLVPEEPGERDAAGEASAGEGHTVRRVLTRSGGRLRPGDTFTLAQGLKATLLERLGERGDRLRFEMASDEFDVFVARQGEVPLPPYIRRPPGPSRELDRERYQTCFARVPGAVAAPTAGLHFTPGIFAALEARGIQRVAFTLHVGPGTFQPIKTQDVEDHRVAPEPFSISPEAALALARAKAEGRRVVAAGTTVLRVLESRWDRQSHSLKPGSGLTDLYVRPPFEFRVVDALLTNFHLPRSSLLVLVAAFAAPGREDGIDWLLRAYRHAMDAGYRFYSYGDACLLNRSS